MPLYEYKCSSCGHRFEKIQKFSDPPIKLCPKCNKSTAERLLSTPAIQFKGTGWYVTDYANKSGPSADVSAEKSNVGSDGKKDGTGSKDTVAVSKEKSEKAADNKPAKEES